MGKIVKYDFASICTVEAEFFNVGGQRNRHTSGHYDANSLLFAVFLTHLKISTLPDYKHLKTTAPFKLLEVSVESLSGESVNLT